MDNETIHNAVDQIKQCIEILRAIDTGINEYNMRLDNIYFEMESLLDDIKDNED